MISIHLKYNNTEKRKSNHITVLYICKKTENMTLHYLNSLRSTKKRKQNKYSSIRNQISQLQIPVCKKYYSEIIHCKYNDFKTPIEFYNTNSWQNFKILSILLI